VSAFVTMCRIEALKLRRTLAVWMILVAPAVVVALQLMIWSRNRTGFAADVNLWQSFLGNVLSMWAIFMQPMFVALVAALVYHVDHASQGWMRLYTLPVPRWTVPSAKLAILVVMTVAATVVLLAGSLAATALAPLLNHRIVLHHEVPLTAVVLRTAKVQAATLLVLVIQNLVSLRWSSLVVSLGVGVTGTFLGLFGTGWKYGPYFPWLMGLLSIHGRPEVIARILWLGPTLSVLVAVATLVYASRRDPGLTP